MNPYNLCDDATPEQHSSALHDIISKNEIVVNALINDGSTTINNIIAFGDDQINKLAKVFSKAMGKQTDLNDEFIQHLVQVAAQELQRIISESQIQTEMLTGLFGDIAPVTPVAPIETKINTGSVGPNVETPTIKAETITPSVIRSPTRPHNPQNPVPPPYTSVIGGEASVDIVNKPLETQFASAISATGEGTNVVFAPTIVQPHVAIRQQAANMREMHRRREDEGKKDHAAEYPVDPLNDPIAWKFAPDDKGWRDQAAQFLGPVYEILLHSSSMDDFQRAIDAAYPYPQG